MDNQTLTQRAELCRDGALKAIKKSDAGLTISQIRGQLPQDRAITQRDIRAAVDQLEQEGVLDFEQWRHKAKVYFIAGQAPRRQVRIVPAAGMPSMATCKNSWFSALGVAA